MFEAIAGYEPVKKELSNILGWYADPNLPDAVRLPRGILLEGRPGVGKTLFLKAVREASPLPVFSFEDQKDEDAKDTLRSLFEQASKEPNGAIILIDELDDLLSSDSRLLSRTLKELMDGLVVRKRVLVIATANSRSHMDSALLRAGRFDREIYIGFPLEADSRAILSMYLEQNDIQSEFLFYRISISLRTRRLFSRWVQRYPIRKELRTSLDTQPFGVSVLQRRAGIKNPRRRRESVFSNAGAFAVLCERPFF